jgi:ATP-binding cassette, subfamily C (CFTR/MRP), member 1
MILLEATEKRNILKTPNETLSKEATSGTFSRSLFFWLTSLLFNGYRSLLSLHDLYPLDERLASKSLSEALQVAWDKGESFAILGAPFHLVYPKDIKPIDGM